MSFLATMAVYLQVAMAVDVPAILLNALQSISSLMMISDQSVSSMDYTNKTG